MTPRYLGRKPLLGKLPQWTPNPAGIPQPVGAWIMNEGSGGKAYDTSGNRLDGNFPGGAANPTWISGRSGPSLNFDGGDHADNIKNFPISGSQKRTVSAWIRTTTINSLSPWGWGEDIIQPAGGEFFLRVENGNIAIRVSAGNRVWTATGSNDGTWRHIVIVSPGTSTSDLLAYMDGRLLSVLGTGPRVLDTTPTPLSIGCHNRSGVYAFKFVGDIGEVLIYSQALAFTQIQYLYQHPYYAWEYPQVYYVPAAVAPGPVYEFIAEHIDTHFVADTLSTHFIAEHTDSHFIAEAD